MQKADPSFVMVKPMGKEGDWKADGYSVNSKTIYQCYAPEEMTGPKAARKVEEDFAGARDRWDGMMQRWMFVWSSERALPPQVVAALASLKDAHLALDIGQMGRAGLWDIVKGLSLADRASLLGIVPDLSAAPMTTAIEIQVLVKHVGQQTPAMADTADLDLTAIAEKLQRNHLSEAVTNMVRPSMPVARLVDKFVTGMPEPGFSQAIALELAEKYKEFAASTDEPDVIFGSIIEYVLGEHHLEPKFFWAAAGIVTYYFELCDIFER
ncbi:MAG TPA: ABC-three component system protein [Terriglobia bacterium]|nr:ABC-three component system protein [Terriglobia bacterium]